MDGRLGGCQVYLEAVGNTVTAQYAYGNSLIRKDGEYPLYDGLGSERTVTNASQAVTGTVNFDAFGNTVGTNGSSTNPYMYAATSGYRNDGDAGLMHVGARYYDAQVGRWTSRDTVLTEHPYLYCEHDPVNWADTTGCSPAPTPPPWYSIGTGVAEAPAWAVAGPAVAAMIALYAMHEAQHQEELYAEAREAARRSMAEMHRARLAAEKQRREYEQKMRELAERYRREYEDRGR